LKVGSRSPTKSFGSTTLQGGMPRDSFPPSHGISLFSGEASERLGLLLDSDSHPVTWRLAAPRTAASSLPTILVTAAGSRVLDAQGSVLASRLVSSAASPEARMKLAVETFQHVATFTSVKSANKIVINLPQGDQLPNCYHAVIQSC
jgi:hypothetical protein